MFSIPQRATATKHYYCTLLMVVTTLSIWSQCCHAKMLATVRNSEHLNRNGRCPGKNEQNIWHSCEHGGYIALNPNPKYCNDRYVCYVGLNEPCSHEDKCADNAICTMCGICQKCDSAENCSEFELCPNVDGFQTLNYIKRFLQKHPDNINSM